MQSSNRNGAAAVSMANHWRGWLAIVDTSADRLSLDVDDDRYKVLYKHVLESCRNLGRSSRAGSVFYRELATMIEPYSTLRALSLADRSRVASLLDHCHQAIDDIEGRRRSKFSVKSLVAPILATTLAGVVVYDRTIGRGLVWGEVESLVAQLRRGFSEEAAMTQLFVFAVAIVAIGLLAMTGPRRR